MTQSLPGTLQHQQVLQTIIDCYAEDDRILAVLLFGSLGRGNWDANSDLDLDVVTRDDVLIDINGELERLCGAIKKENGLEAIIIPDGDEGDVVLSNLVEFSIRYHALGDTKAAIVESMIALSGSLSLDQIRAAGEANRPHPPELTRIVSQCIRYALGVRKAIARHRLWTSIELLHRIRLHLMEVFTLTRGGERALQFFEAQASAEFQDRLGRLMPHPEMASVESAFGEVVKLLNRDLEAFGNGQVGLTDQQRAVLQRLDRL